MRLSLLHSRRDARTRKRATNDQRSFGWFTIAIMLLFASMLAQQSKADSANDAEGGMLYLTSQTGHQQQALHLDTDVVIDIVGLSASVTVKQSFSNSTDDWTEGIYVFPLPENSAVNRMRMTMGNRVIEGEVKERREAKKIYTAAKNSGKKAALVEQERPNLFTQSVANIAPGETITVELHYLQDVDFNQNRFALRFPMTLTPRYIPGTPLADIDAEGTIGVGSNGWGIATRQVTDAPRITPFYLNSPRNSNRNAISLSVNLNPGIAIDNIRSASHQINVDSLGKAAKKIQLRGDHSILDRDFELEWQPQPSEQAAAAIFHEQHNQDSFVQLMLLPPQVQSQSAILPRELILIIDTSGSMQGTSIQQAKQSLLWALNKLKPRDRFNVIEFNSYYRSLFSSAVRADATNIHHAREFVKGLQASGGTEMAPALQAALAQPADEGYLKQVVFITDGSVGNETELFALINEELDNARLFTVGIGSAPNSYFMRKAAQFGRGTFTYVGATSQVNERMGRLFSKLENPVMADIKVHWPDQGLTEVYPAAVPDLYLGEPLFINARITNALTPGSRIRISGTIAGKQWHRELILPTPTVDQATADQDPMLATQWARQKIAALLDEEATGRSASTVREQVLEVALPFKLLSPYTSFVAVETEIARPPERPLQSRPLANHLPAGQSAPALMYPQTATSANLSFYLGLLALMLVLVVRQGLRDA